ncbi:MAG: hypothetical protein ACKVOS_03650 [Sphingorhabdus sp.]|uniref:hypothetical protein n=1 Tax=Sphingorhabdus sp. TaxID=1902408 RepID=UPI0038FD022D
MASSLPKARRIVAKLKSVGCEFWIVTGDNGKPDLVFGPNNKTDEQKDWICNIVLTAFAMPRLYSAIIRAAIETKEAA